MKLSEKIKRKVYNFAGKVANSLAQNQGGGDKNDKSITPGMPELVRAVACEGAVLLKNNGVLPFKSDDNVALFGRNQIETFFVGYGSGGDVNEPYKVSYLDGIKNCESIKINKKLADKYIEWCSANPVDEGVWGRWPRYFPEMPFDAGLIADAAEESNRAVVFIGRSSGEDRENALEEGSYYLTSEEKKLIGMVAEKFESIVIVLNIGSIIDFSWMDEFSDKIGAVLITWQGGMESGNALADILSGKVSPSGKLTDTVACAFEDYPSSADFGAKKYNNYTEDIFVGYRYFSTFAPEKVRYPFGFGLGYADFDVQCIAAERTEDKLNIKVNVKNISDKFSGKETVQLYYSSNGTKLINPDCQLIAFRKTKLLAPSESQQLDIVIPLNSLSSYDDSGVTEYAYAWVLEKGEYTVFVGTDCASAEPCMKFEIDETNCVEQLTQVSAAKVPFERIDSYTENNGKKVPVKHSTPESKTDLRQIISADIPQGFTITGDKGYKLSDVKQGRIALDVFVSQLDLTELEAISRGDYVMNSPLGAKGNAGTLGGVLESLRDKGIPAITTTDGPSGIRLHASCSLLPIGAILASTFNEELVEELYTLVGKEMAEKGSDVLLAPGMNIHRSPLCGRNFEYFSEDPLVSGKIAACVVRGVQASGLSACPKHFACNNQETNRCYNDSRLSERALREIYLKGFEICVKEAEPKCIMTSYNKINGVWGHYNYELCTTVLRKEWGYKGMVMTDWWMRKSKSPEFPKLRDNAYRVRAQVDVLMPGGGRTGKRKPDGTLLKTYGKPDGITIGELQQTAKNVIRLAMAINK